VDGKVLVAPLLGTTLLGSTLLGADVESIGAGVESTGAVVGSAVVGSSGVVVGLLVPIGLLIVGWSVGAVVVAPLLGVTVLGTTLLGAGVGSTGAGVGSTVVGSMGVVVELVVELEEIGANVGILSTSSIIVLQKLSASSSLLASSPTVSIFPADEPTPKVKATRNALVIKNCIWSIVIYNKRRDLSFVIYKIPFVCRRMAEMDSIQKRTDEICLMDEFRLFLFCLFDRFQMGVTITH
jgi:hypothetical protein